MNRIYLVIALFFISSNLAQKGVANEPTIQLEEAKKANIRKLIILDEQKELTRQACEEIFSSIKKKSIGIPKKDWEDIVVDIEKKELLEELIPIYDKYLSHEDVKELLACTPLSEPQKVKFDQKKLKINVIWGHKLAMKIQQKLWDRNINFDIYDELDDYDAISSKSLL
jgi:uncharacterized protein